MDEARSHMKSRYNMVYEIDGCQVWSMNHEREAWIGQPRCLNQLWSMCMDHGNYVKHEMSYEIWILGVMIYYICLCIYMGVGSIDCKTEDLTMTTNSTDITHPIPSIHPCHSIPSHPSLLHSAGQEILYISSFASHCTNRLFISTAVLFHQQDTTHHIHLAFHYMLWHKQIPTSLKTTIHSICIATNRYQHHYTALNMPDINIQASIIIITTNRY
jgi:hypothetical protein